MIEPPIELPNPLVVNGVDYPQQFRTYIHNRGGCWTDLPHENKSSIWLPKGAYIEEVEYTGVQVIISFPDAGFIVWFRFKNGLYSRLNIPGDAFECVGETRTFHAFDLR